MLRLAFHLNGFWVTWLSFTTGWPNLTLGFVVFSMNGSGFRASPEKLRWNSS